MMNAFVVYEKSSNNTKIKFQKQKKTVSEIYETEHSNLFFHCCTQLYNKHS